MMQSWSHHNTSDFKISKISTKNEIYEIFYGNVKFNKI